jgi:hypothetical protein
LFGTWASILYTKRKKDEKVIRLVGWNTCEAAELYRRAHTHTHGDGERERDAQNEMLKHERVGSIKR